MYCRDVYSNNYMAPRWLSGCGKQAVHWTIFSVVLFISSSLRRQFTGHKSCSHTVRPDARMQPHCSHCTCVGSRMFQQLVLYDQSNLFVLNHNYDRIGN